MQAAEEEWARPSSGKRKGTKSCRLPGSPDSTRYCTLQPGVCHYCLTSLTDHHRSSAQGASITLQRAVVLGKSAAGSKHLVLTTLNICSGSDSMHSSCHGCCRTRALAAAAMATRACTAVSTDIALVVQQGPWATVLDPRPSLGSATPLSNSPRGMPLPKFSKALATVLET